MYVYMGKNGMPQNKHEGYTANNYAKQQCLIH